MLPLAALVALAHAYTVTYLFSDARYAPLTLAVARASFRLARRDPHDFEARTRLTIWVLDASGCAQFAPFFCVSLGRPSTGDYFALIERRLPVLLAMLEHPPADVTGVLMLDSDVALRRNVADRMERYGADLVFQRELPCARRRCVNAGVWWVRTGSEPARRVVAAAVSLMRLLAVPDQDALEIALASAAADLRVAYLPIERYPNGFVHAVNDRLEARRIHLVHANWDALAGAKVPRLDALARDVGRWLAPSVNQTAACAALRRLDAQNLAAALDCGRPPRTACNVRLQARCLP